MAPDKKTRASHAAAPPLASTPAASEPGANPPVSADEAKRAAPVSVPVVGIGASAGGLEAFEAFFRACPADSGMAFVLVPHLDPGHESLLAEILQRSTTMPVVQAQDQVVVAANHVYVIPPNRDMAMLGGALQLSTPELARGLRMPIDAFFRSLAEDQAERSVGVILSGTATDGTLGLRAIAGAGGICMVQEPATAKYDGMPQSAIAAGYATHILPVERMPAILLEVVRPSAYRHQVLPVAPQGAVNGMNQVLLQLRSATGHDFSQYKKSTIGRRIERRMMQHGIDDMAVYARLLKDNPSETQKLFKELLINVTSFFRDPEAFVVLKTTILPRMLANKPSGYIFRVWVAGCATGEEAYSLAIVLLELIDELKFKSEQEVTALIYATDLDDDAITVARTGRYPLNIAQDLSQDRLRRFFSKDEVGYKVKKGVRDMVVFAVHSVIKDPPFTKIDLLSCRNLMIYLEQEQQNRLIPTFHYALKPDGVLFLSASESITNQADLFATIDRKWKFYRAVHSARSPQLHSVHHGSWAQVGASGPAKDVAKKPKEYSFDEAARNLLLQIYAPGSVVTDTKGNILHVYGDTGRFLRPAPGQASLNVVDMARDGLQLELRTALLGATSEVPLAVNREISVKTNGGFSPVRLSVRRLPNPRSAEGAAAEVPLLLMSFQDVAPTPPGRGRGKGGGAKTEVNESERRRSDQLERELEYAHESQQVSVEEQRAFNEELKSTNEELQSANEELQSSNEELETSKEELQSLNEELITVNAELNSKIEQLNNVQNDMKNLLDSVSTGTLFLDANLIIRRYTQAALKAYRLIATDIGRPLGDIKSTIQGDDLLVDLQTVHATLIPIEREVRTIDGKWYLARMQPYRTLDNIIAGVVLSFTEVTDLKLASDAVQRAQGLAEGIINMVHEPLIVLDNTLQVVSASRSFYKQFKVIPEDTVGRKLYDLGNGQWNIATLRQLLENILPEHQVLNGYVVEHDFPNVGRRRIVLDARRIVTELGSTELILLAVVANEPMEEP